YPGYVAWGANYPYYENHWLFVEPAFFYGYPVYRHCYPYGRNTYYYHESNWAGPWHNGTTRTVFVGPHRTFIASRSSQPIRTASMQSSAQRGLRSTYTEGERPTLPVYRPSGRAASRAPVSGPRVGSGLARGTLQTARPSPSARPTWSSTERVSPRDVRPPEAAPPVRNPPVFRAPTPASDRVPGPRHAPAPRPRRFSPSMRTPPPP